MFRTAVRNMSGRVPLIKFRQGGIPEHGAHPVNVSAAAPAAKGGKRTTISAGIIEDWQLPARYRRRAISDDECEAINLGGAP